MQDLIADFGYIAIFIGTFLEGESVLALGGVAAAHGYLSFTAVVAVAIVAAVGYVAWYAIEQWIGRLKHVQIVLLMTLVLAAIIWGIVAHLRRRSSDG